MSGSNKNLTFQQFAARYRPEVLEPKVFAEYLPPPGKIERSVHIQRAQQRV
jgi:hypothetical protein